MIDEREGAWCAVFVDEAVGALLEARSVSMHSRFENRSYRYRTRFNLQERAAARHSVAVGSRFKMRSYYTWESPRSLVSVVRVPIFPLSTVLFPGGPLPLRIFEARYVDMIGRCMKDDSPFGVVLIREGGEVGPSRTYDVGTLARIVDFYQGSDGLLGVTARGERRFRLLSSYREADGLNVGEIELLPEEQELPLPEEYRPMAAILSGVLDELGRLYEDLDRRLDDAGWVTNRFVEILPIDLEEKQLCLEQSDPAARLQLVKEVLKHVRSPTGAA